MKVTKCCGYTATKKQVKEKVCYICQKKTGFEEHNTEKCNWLDKLGRSSN